MDYDELMRDIQARGEFRDREHAEQAARAVLSVLGERLAGGEPGDLAAQLPVEIAEALPSRGGGEAFDLEEFDRRVAEREAGDSSLAEAHRHAIAVMTAVLSAVSPGERDDVAAQLPREFIDFLP